MLSKLIFKHDLIIIMNVCEIKWLFSTQCILFRYFLLHHKSKSQQNVLYIIKMYGDIFDWLRKYLFPALSFSFIEEAFCIKNMVFVSFARTRPDSLQHLGIVSSQRLIIKHFDNQTRKLYFLFAFWMIIRRISVQL